MIITKKKIDKSLFNIKIGQNKIQQQDNIKYLGVMIDNGMNWSKHIMYLNAKLSKGAWALSKLRKYVNINTLKTIYYSLIYSHLKYCITSWGKASKTIIQPVINTQKRVVKIISGKSYETSLNPLFNNLQLLKLTEIYKLQIAIAVKNLKNIKKITDIKTSIKNLKQIHRYNTKLSSKFNYHIPSVQTMESPQ